MEQADCKRFGEFRMDLHERTLHRNEAAVPLGRRAFEVLAYFVDHPGRVLTKEELLEQIWGDVSVDENNLSQSISALRKALDQQPGGSGYIVTLAGRGYQFTARVEGAPPSSAIDLDASGETVLVERHTQTSTTTHNLRRVPSFRSRASLFALVLLLAAGGYSAWRWIYRPPPPDGTKVLLEPFQNTTGDNQFDQTLERALQIDLDESPFVSLLTQAQVNDSLTRMQRQPGQALTHLLALEVCERNNAQATLRGAIVRVGQSFLLTFEADSCVTGKRIAGSKAEVASKDEVLQALDKGVDALRRQLGESAASRERYETPIMQATSSSLDALRAYSLGQISFDRGDMPGAQTLFEQAVSLDPNFASAYMALATTFLNRGDTDHAAAFYKKAYELRGHVSERERLTIEGVYFANGIGDYEESIRRFKQMVQIYPATTTAWITLANTYQELGEYPEAVAAGESAVRSDPHSGVAAEVLARAYERANRFTEANRVARQAIAQGRDHWGIHSILFQIASFQHDTAAVTAETAWMMAHPPLTETYEDLGFAATLEGKLRAGVDDFNRARIEFVRGGDRSSADLQQLNLARFYTLFDETDKARASLKQMTTDGGDLPDKALFQARVGDLAPAKSFVAKSGTPGERDTVSIYIGVPLVAAEIALQEHRPLDALRALDPTTPYLLNSFDILFVRARAKTEAGQLDAAAADYRLAIANPGIDPVAAEYWLAHLYLARVLVLQHNPTAARAEYQTFLTGWSAADPDTPVIKAAKAEAAKL